MEINLKDTLKSLRKKKNVTQEALAEYLGITQQSVGKWERGEGFPDITMLPKLALYFNISIDDLLNVGQSRITEKIKEYNEESDRLARLGENDARIALWEQAYSEFPNNHTVMRNLQRAILCKGKWPVPDEDAEVAIRLGTRILEESTDSDLRESAISELCFVYNSRGDKERALQYANMAGSMYNSREELRANVLEGEEGILESQNYLMQLVYLAYLVTLNLSTKSDTPEREVRVLEFGIKLLKLMFADDDYCGLPAHDLAYLYSLIARVYARQQNAEMTIPAIEECVKFSVMDAQKTEGFYTSPVFDRLQYGKIVSKNYKGNSCNISLKTLSWNCFDFIRANPRFKELEETLKENAEVI